MKKLTAMLLALAMVLSLAVLSSCGGGEADPTPTPTATPTENPTGEPTTEPTGTEETPTPTEGPSAEDQEKADAVVERINKIEDITAENYSSFKSKIENARKYYDKLTDTQKALIGDDLVKKLTKAEKAYSNYAAIAAKAAALTVNRLMMKTVDVDGEIDPEYLMGTALVLSKATIDAYTDEQKAANGALVGDTSLASDNTEIVLYFALDDDYLYICEKRSDDTWAYTASSYKQPYTGDGSLIWFAKDGSLMCGLQWNYATKESTAPQIGLFQNDDQTNAELKNYYAVQKEYPNYHVLEVAVPLADLGLTKADFTAKAVGLTFCSVDIVDASYDGDSSKLWTGVGYQMQYPGVNSLENAQRFYTQTAPAYSYIADGTPTIDGQPDDLYKEFEGMELSQGTCLAFTSEEKAVGAGMVGDTTIGDSADTHVIFRFAVDAEYLYVFEELQDLTRVFSATTFRQPYAGDGALVWFTKDGNLKCGLQWNIATQESPDAPQIGLFQNDDQTNSELKEYEWATGTDETGYSLYLEVKVPLADLGLTYEDFTSASVGMTFCCVDIVKEDFSGNTGELWSGIGYQMQYPGVNNWGSAPRLIIK